ncbi:170_t:CDS:1, partial [Diversispora eburnea]
PVTLKNLLRKNGGNIEDNKLILKEWYRICRKYMFGIWIERTKKILEWEKSVGITKERKMGKSCGVGLKYPDYTDTKKNLEHSSEKIINRTINA